MSIRSSITSSRYWPGRFLFGARVARDESYNSQSETIFIAYALNALLVAVLVIAGNAVVGIFASPRTVVFCDLGAVIAISNVASYALTYLSSLGWNLNSRAIERLRGIARSRGFLHHFVDRFLMSPILFCWGALSLILVMGLFRAVQGGLLDIFGIGASSVVVNVIFIQALFVRRSLRRADAGRQN